MAGTTKIVGYRDAKALRDGAAEHQALGFKTVQVGPSDDVLERHGDDHADWPFEAGKQWYILLASKDPITNPSNAPAEE